MQQVQEERSLRYCMRTVDNGCNTPWRRRYKRRRIAIRCISFLLVRLGGFPSGSEGDRQTVTDGHGVGLGQQQAMADPSVEEQRQPVVAVNSATSTASSTPPRERRSRRTLDERQEQSVDKVFADFTKYDLAVGWSKLYPPDTATAVRRGECYDHACGA